MVIPQGLERCSPGKARVGSGAHRAGVVEEGIAGHLKTACRRDSDASLRAKVCGVGRGTVGRRREGIAGGGLRGVRVGEANKPGPCTEGGSAGSGGQRKAATTDGQFQSGRGSTFDHAEGEDPLEMLGGELEQR